MDKITKINFDKNQDYVWGIRGFTQWDYGQYLEISGLDISTESVEVHFSLEEFQGAAERIPGEVKDGVIHTKIPQFILEGPEYCCGISYNAYAWVYVLDEESAETIRKIELSIDARPKPPGYIHNEDDVLTIEKCVEQALDKAKESGEFDGKDGKSAYQYAKEGGFEGTEKEFIELLVQDVFDCIQLKDSETEKTYKLQVVNGKLTMEGVED